MKLPDFSTDSQWNALRKGMNADYIQLSENTWQNFDSQDLLDRLRQGIEVNLEEVIVSADGTFDYQGVKVLIYIKDQNYYPDRDGEYKFHVSNCKTIEDFRRGGQLDRYVVSRKTTGEFVVNIYDKANRKYIRKDEVKRLNVCKYCLANISYKGYTTYSRTPKIYDTFSLDEFFNLYGTSQFKYVPSRMSDNVPLNEYSSDFTSISEQLRKSQSWRCQHCSLSLESNKGYLHVHHRNGLKWDNQPSNLECVCLGCHANSPGHYRMKFSAEYSHFMTLYGKTWASLTSKIS